jgi:hypothetical protein
MDGLPVTIRLLDPPLHEFLPQAGPRGLGTSGFGGRVGILWGGVMDVSWRDREPLHESLPQAGLRGIGRKTVPQGSRGPGSRFDRVVWGGGDLVVWGALVVGPPLLEPVLLPHSASRGVGFFYRGRRRPRDRPASMLHGAVQANAAIPPRCRRRARRCTRSATRISVTRPVLNPKTLNPAAGGPGAARALPPPGARAGRVRQADPGVGHVWSV